jgi:hypothetical protein
MKANFQSSENTAMIRTALYLFFLHDTTTGAQRQFSAQDASPLQPIKAATEHLPKSSVCLLASYGTAVFYWTRLS